VLLSLALFFSLTTKCANGQELTHPLDMKLPASSYQRPDPADLQLSLDNGLIAFIARADQVPLVTLSAFVRAGMVDDDKQGAIESLANALKISGPEGMDPGEFKTLLEHMTADYTVLVHDEWLEITLNVPSEDLHRALPLFAGILRSPQITMGNIEQAAMQAAPAATDLSGESGAALYEGSLDAAVRQFHDQIYAAHPYARRPDSAEFAELTVDDIARFHAKFFVPGNITLAIAGDIDLDDSHTAILDLFGDWTAADAPEPPRIPAVRAMQSAQHHFTANKLQSWLVFGHALPQIPLEDQAALEVMNYILAGGHLWTRMTVETRYKYGYTNDASGFIEDKWFGPGSYSFRSYSRPEVIKAIYDNMMDEVIRIRSEQVSDEELFVAKGALADGAFQVRYLDGYSSTRNFALEQLRYGNHDRSASYLRRVRAVDADDVLEAARKYLHPDEMQVVLVGRPAQLLE